MTRDTPSRPWRAVAAGLVALIGLSACASHPADGGPDSAHFANDEYGVSMFYPTTLRASHDFSGDYLLPARWNPDSEPTLPGQPLLELTLPESDKLVDARLRLGASDDTRAAADCSLPARGSAPRRDDVGSARIGGVTFRRVDTGDEAMNHFLQRHSYRAVVGGDCVAIDLVVSGVNPGVYPDNPKPSMTPKQAFRRLTALLDGVRFQTQ